MAINSTWAGAVTPPVNPNDWNQPGHNKEDNRSVLQNGVRYLGLIAKALQDGFPTTVGVSTVAGLPSAATAGQGARRMVTDANATTFASVVAGSGTNIVPVFSDGTNWRIG